MNLYTAIIQDHERDIFETPLIKHIKANSREKAFSHIVETLCYTWDLDAETLDQDFEITVVPVIESEIEIA